MNFKTVLSILLLAVIVLGCRIGHGIRGNGELYVEDRDVKSFTKVEVSGAFEVFIEVGGEQSIEVSTDENLIDYVETKVQGSTLYIDTRRDIDPRTMLKVEISVPELKAIEGSGANTVKARGITSERFRIDLSGACKIAASGEVESMDISLSGASSCNVSKIEAIRVNADLSGASKAEVNVIEYLFADLSGASKLRYEGDPEKIKSDVSGASSLRRK